MTGSINMLGHRPKRDSQIARRRPPPLINEYSHVAELDHVPAGDHCKLLRTIPDDGGRASCTQPAACHVGYFREPDEFVSEALGADQPV